ETNLALFEYIDGFYNSRRIQKRLGYLSPIEFQEKHYADQATAERLGIGRSTPAADAVGRAHRRAGIHHRPACTRHHASGRPLPGDRPRTALLPPGRRTVHHRDQAT
ncbi:IS3 family transposase, partial [Streptomyces sp. NPDC088246]|uniref:IS3 family transposase n=1 Tax=Streptomyces sp. NPDC088246 TaxID=3365842 RepID=UPI0038304D25